MVKMWKLTLLWLWKAYSPLEYLHSCVSLNLTLQLVQTRSVARSCPTICDPMDCSDTETKVHPTEFQAWHSWDLASLARTFRFQGISGEKKTAVESLVNAWSIQEKSSRRKWRARWPRGLAVPFSILAGDVEGRGGGGPSHSTPGSCGPAAAEVTCKGVRVDGLQSLQLVALLLAVICHRGPRCSPWIAQTPRRRAAAWTAAALGEQAAAGRAQAQSPRRRGLGPTARLGLLSKNPAPASACSLVPRSTRRAWPLGCLSHARSGLAGMGEWHLVWHLPQTPKDWLLDFAEPEPEKALSAASSLY